jgi:P-type E1-E2 ATPase
MVEYVFSDKTGTLTCNIMKFICFYIGKEIYGQEDLPTSSGGNTIETLSDREIHEEKPAS